MRWYIDEGLEEWVEKRYMHICLGANQWIENYFLVSRHYLSFRSRRYSFVLFCQVCHSWLISICHFNKDVKMLLLLRTPWLFGIYLYGNSIDLGKFHNNFNLMLVTSLLVVLHYLWILASDNFLAGFYYASCWWTWIQVLFKIYRKGE